MPDFYSLSPVRTSLRASHTVRRAIHRFVFLSLRLTLRQANRRANLERALEILAKDFQAPRILDVDDLLQVLGLVVPLSVSVPAVPIFLRQCACVEDVSSCNSSLQNGTFSLSCRKTRTKRRWSRTSRR